jgi:hypothetical protein
MTTAPFWSLTKSSVSTAQSTTAPSTVRSSCPPFVSLSTQPQPPSDSGRVSSTSKVRRTYDVPYFPV